MGVTTITQDLRSFYFTFGSDASYPRECRDGYVKVMAGSEREAVETFRRFYPDRDPGCLNCAFYYAQKEWDSYVGVHYHGQAPAAVLYSSKAGREAI